MHTQDVKPKNNVQEVVLFVNHVGVVEIELTLPGLASRTFIYWATSLAQ